MPENVMLPMLSLVLFVCIGKYNLNDVFEDAYRPPLLCTEGTKTVIQQRGEGGSRALQFGAFSSSLATIWKRAYFYLTHSTGHCPFGVQCRCEHRPLLRSTCRMNEIQPLHVIKCGKGSSVAAPGSRMLHGNEDTVWWSPIRPSRSSCGEAGNEVRS